MDDFGLWDVFVSMFWFMLLIAWIWLVISILTDIFRDRELSGGGKALWTIFLIFLPWLGALMYLIVRGDSMNKRTQDAARAQHEQMATYIKETAGTSASVTDQLKELSELRSSGAISDAEYDQAKLKILA
jgi:hypothetical protein